MYFVDIHDLVPVYLEMKKPSQRKEINGMVRLSRADNLLVT